MTNQTPDSIKAARQAFRAGEISRGAALVHQVLQQDIGNQDAWRLLFSYLGRGKTFEAFCREFAEKYYPDQLEEVEAALANASPFRRVSLVGDTRDRLESEETVGPEADLPKAGPLPKPRRVDDLGSAEQEGGFLRRIFRLVRRSRSRPVTREEPGRLGRWLDALSARFARQGLSARGPVRERKDVQGTQPVQEPAPGPPAIDSGLTLLSLNRSRPTAETRVVSDEPADPAEGARTLVKSVRERRGIRVLIADDIDHTREMIQKLLLFEPSVDVVGTAASGTEAVAQAAALEPDIVLLDINMPDMDGLTALRRIRAGHALTQVIMLTVQDDPGYLRDALQSGARDYLIKPPMIDDLLETIHNAYAIGKAERDRLEQLARAQESLSDTSRPHAPGQVAAVFSPKGGVGCSLIAANLAAALRVEDASVVLVDCDLQFGAVGLMFNEIGRNSIADLAHLSGGIDRKKLDEFVVHHPETGVDLILAPGRKFARGAVTGMRLAEVVHALRGLYDYVIVDLASPIDDVSLSVLESCDRVLLVTTQDIPAINDIRRMLDLAPQAGIDPEKISLVLNQYHSRVKITPEQISTNLRTQFASVIPLDSQTVVSSINRGVPFMHDRSLHDLPIGKGMRELKAHLLLERESAAAD